jgi:Rrf2 family protein
VNISAKVEYACIAVLELAARNGSGQPVRIRTIADAHGIPSRFLVQILLQLKGAGIVASTRGAAGGYRLMKDPADITLGEVMGIFEGQPNAITSNAGIATPSSKALLDVWREVAEVQREMLENITFADLVERTQSQSEQMYYI